MFLHAMELLVTPYPEIEDTIRVTPIVPTTFIEDNILVTPRVSSPYDTPRDNSWMLWAGLGALLLFMRR